MARFPSCNNGKAKLELIEKKEGKDWLSWHIAARISVGEQPLEIARSLGVSYIDVKRWVEENCLDLVNMAKRAHADVLVGDVLRHVDEAQPEDVAVARLKAETKLKVASKLDKQSWGDGNSVGGGFGGITIVIGDVVKEEKVIEGEVVERI